MVESYDLDPLIERAHQLERSGLVLHFDFALRRSFPGFYDVEERLREAVAQGVLRLWQFNYPQQTATAYSVVHHRLTPHVMQTAISALERNRLIPYASRVHDVLIGLFDLHITDEQLRQIYSHLRNPANIFRAITPTGSCEQVFPIKKLKGLQPYVASPLLSQKIRKFFEESGCHLPDGTFMKTLFFKFRKRTNDNIYAIYRTVETLELRHSIDDPSPALSLRTLLEEENPEWSAAELDEIIAEMLGPTHLPHRAGSLPSPELPVADDLGAEGENECPICLEDLIEAVFELECRHEFHTSCILSHLKCCQAKKEPALCAFCRKPISRNDSRLIHSGKHTYPVKPIPKVPPVHGSSRSVSQPKSRTYQCQACTLVNTIDNAEEYAACEVCCSLHCLRCSTLAERCSC